MSAGARESTGTSRDMVTLLVCGPGQSASKSISASRDGKPNVQGFNAGMHFAVMEREVQDIRELSEVLRALETLPNVLVIRGAPVPTLSERSGVRRTKANFATPAQGRRWVLLDFDKIPLPSGMDVRKDPVVVAEHLVSRLPAEFHGVSYHFQLSSSAGLKDDGTASMHIWFWLTAPHTDKDLKRWGQAVNKTSSTKLVDTALFNDVQAHYVAAPVFVGMDDPLPVRSGLVTKAAAAVLLQIPEAPISPVFKTGVPDRSPPAGFEALLDRIGDHPGGEGFHEPIIRAIASAVGAQGREGTNVEQLFETVRQRVLAADRSQHDKDYVEHMASREHILPAIEGALTKFGDANPRRKARVIPGMTPHFAEGEELSPEAASGSLDKALRAIVKVPAWPSA